MYVVNNIVNTKINSVWDATQINFNDPINITSRSFWKRIGSSNPIGDFSLGVHSNINLYQDGDRFDQTSLWLFGRI